ncbi:MAG: FtsX-like permease family protein [Acidobacteriota bacterium]
MRRSRPLLLTLPLASSLEWSLAWRTLRGRRRSRLLSGTAQVALLATALGVTALVIAMALMTGYRDELEQKLSGGDGAVLAIPLRAGGPADPQGDVEQISAVPGVVAVRQVVLGQGVLTSEADPQGLEVTVRGIDPGAGLLGASEEQLAADDEGLPGAVLGVELARHLGVEAGDPLRLAAVSFVDGRPQFRYLSIRVNDTFSSGLSEFDRAWLLLARAAAQDLFGTEGVSSMLEIIPQHRGEASALAEIIGEDLGDDYLVTDWLALNRGLFTALALQKKLLFLVLGLIVFVSTFNVASTLVVAVRERTREIGVLQALGLSRRRLVRVFLIYGGLLGSVGVAAGVIFGAGTAFLLDYFEVIRFDAEVAAIYFINAVRFKVQLVDLAAIVVFALAVNLIACLLPARRAARIDPSRALRYE